MSQHATASAGRARRKPIHASVSGTPWARLPAELVRAVKPGRRLLVHSSHEQPAAGQTEVRGFNHYSIIGPDNRIVAERTVPTVDNLPKEMVVPVPEGRPESDERAIDETERGLDSEGLTKPPRRIQMPPELVRESLPTENVADAPELVPIPRELPELRREVARLKDDGRQLNHRINDQRQYVRNLEKMAGERPLSSGETIVELITKFIEGTGSYGPGDGARGAIQSIREKEWAKEQLATSRPELRRMLREQNELNKKLQALQTDIALRKINEFNRASRGI